MSTIGFSSVFTPLETESLPLRQLYPITFRGTVFLILVTYLALGPARYQADIIASVLAYSLIVAAIPLIFITIVRGIRMKSAISLGVSSSDNQATADRIEAKKPTRLALQIPALSIPPFFVLNIRARFPDRGVILAEHVITGSLDRPRYLVEDIVFPHRGVWEFERVRIEFGDQLGLFRFGWILERSKIHSSFTVYPSAQDASSLPVISSCERSGDLVSHTRERLGDPFDLRQYHPSDGARRILWKVFARRGELVSRHPEASMTPEGQVLIFAPLVQNDDESAGLAVDYVKRLEEMQLQIYFGCLGMSGVTPARTSIAVEELLVDTAWSIPDTASEAQAELEAFLEHSSNQIGGESSIRRVVLFISPHRFCSAADRILMTQLSRALESRNIQPVIITTQSTRLLPVQHNQTGLRQKFDRLVFEQLPEPEPIQPAEYRSFMGLCAAEGWEVIVNGEA